MYLNICEKSDFLSIILYMKEIMNIIRIGIPIILILMCTIDLAQQMLDPDSKARPTSKLIKRMIAASAIFFIPNIVNLVLNMAGSTGVTSTLCWTNANKTTIASLKAEEEKEKEEKQKALDKEQEESKKASDELAASREEIRQKNEELASEKKENLTTVNDATFLKENGTDGMVTVVDGIFYYPSTGQSGVAGTKGSAPYGYNIYFFKRLEVFIAAAAKEGHKIRYSTSEYGAWRPIENQEYYWNCYQTKSCNNGNPAARPGTSKHGWGIASDLKFDSGSHGVQAAKYWAHDNAYKYGLNFSMCQNIRGYCQEDWHIQPANLKKK